MVHDIICWLYNINIFYCLDSISHCIIVHSVYFWSSSLILNIRILEAKRNTVFENCTTRQYLDTIERACNCVPYALQSVSGTPLVSLIDIYFV